MKFGKSLSEKVRHDWKEYAVSYKEMKRVIPKDDLFIEPTPSYPEYWALYQQSQDAITTFYNEKTVWANQEAQTLQSRLEKYRLSKLPGSTVSCTTSVEELIKCTLAYKIELEYIREFLSINHTAFSKILKKYDKRTFSNVREEKLEEIVKTHPFLDGTAMDRFLQKANFLMNSLELLERRPASAPSAVAGAGTGGARGMTRQKADSYRNMGKPTTGTSGIQGRSRGPSLGSRDIIETTKGILDDIDKSPFFTKNKAKRNPRFRHEEIKTGPILGKGEYSIVREVTAFDITDSCPICVIHNFKESADSSSGSMKASESSDQMFDRNAKKKEVSVNAHTRNANRHESELNLSGMYIAEDNVSDSDMNSFQDDHEEEDHEDVANRGFMKHHCFRDGSARYAIKQLKSTLTGTKRADGAIDLAIEAKFLSVLCGHPNIIKLCGLGGTSGHPNSFIILDRLYDTLDVKIDYWKAKEDEYTGFLGMKKHKPQLKLLFNERLLAGYDIGRAVKYLHSNEYVHRSYFYSFIHSSSSPFSLLTYLFIHLPHPILSYRAASYTEISSRRTLALTYSETLKSLISVSQKSCGTRIKLPPISTKHQDVLGLGDTWHQRWFSASTTESRLMYFLSRFCFGRSLALPNLSRDSSMKSIPSLWFRRDSAHLLKMSGRLSSSMSSRKLGVTIQLSVPLSTRFVTRSQAKSQIQILSMELMECRALNVSWIVRY